MANIETRELHYPEDTDLLFGAKQLAMHSIFNPYLSDVAINELIEMPQDFESLTFASYDEEGIVVATASLVFPQRLPDNRAAITDVATDKDMRRQGLGTAIIEELERTALSRDVATLELHPLEVGFEEFYRQLGYRFVEGNGLMIKHLV